MSFLFNFTFSSQILSTIILKKRHRFQCHVCALFFSVGQEKRKMLRLEVIVLCLLFGALTHSQGPECISECHQTEPLWLQCHSNMSC